MPGQRLKQSRGASKVNVAAVQLPSGTTYKKLQHLISYNSTLTMLLKNHTNTNTLTVSFLLVES